MNDPIEDGEENYAGSLTGDFVSHGDVGEYLEVNKGRLTFCHINCNHLIPHINELRIMLQSSDVEFIGVGETFLSDSLATPAVDIKGYRFIRNDRTVLGKPNVGGGGIGLYIKACIAHKIVAQSMGLGIEFLFITVNINNDNVLVGVVYRPPSTSIVYKGLEANNYGINELEKVLAELIPLYDKLYMFGDFNVDLLDDNDPLYGSFTNILNTFMLYNVSLRPTRLVSGKLLDLFLTTDPESVLDYYQHDVCWSDHDMIFMSVNAVTPTAHTVARQVRGFKNIDQNKLTAAASVLDWTQVLHIPGINNKLDIFYNYLNELLDNFAPLKTIKSKNTNLNDIAHWCDDTVEEAINARNTAYKIWRSNIHRIKDDRDRNWRDFREKRRLAKRVTVRKHSKFVGQYLNPRLPPKKLFTNLRKFGLIKCKNNQKVDVDAEQLSNQFAVQPADERFLNFDVPIVDNIPKFSFKNIDSKDILDAIKQIKSDAAGNDEIPMSFIKLLVPIILPILTHIFNYIFTTSEFPQRWKTSIVIPVPKKINPSLLSDYRPISLLPCFSKMFEVVMARQMTEHINMNRLLSPFQSGFRCGHSTSTAVLKVSEDIRSNLGERQATVLVLLDFSQAFDTVVRALATIKMRNSFAFEEDSSKLLHSYLNDRYQFIRTTNGDSILRKTECGVPQGSVLGPLIYICYSNDVSSVISFCKFHGYADDLQLYHTAEVKDLKRCYDEVNIDLSRISKWARENGLRLNPKKSQVILIHRLPGNIPQPQLILDADMIKVVPKVVDLGFVLNSKLTPVDHITQVCQKIYWILRSIKPHTSCTPISVRKKLIETLVITHINYSNIVYAHIDSGSSNRLRVAYNACLRYVHGLGRRDSVADLQHSINGFGLKESAVIQQLKFLFKIIHFQHPSYLSSFVQFSSSQRTHNLNLPVFQHSAVAQSFFVVVPKLWNELPHAIKSIASLGRFVGEVKLRLAQPP
jgi:Reverse transcriptase (RNA-dependent DNA polymerase)